MTSAHPRDDVRIFFKECRGLARNGYSVSLVVADGLGDETREGVRIFDTGRPRSRLARMLAGARRVYAKGIELDADVYQFHDPELLPYANRLRRRGKRVIYDVHEDVPRQVMAKHYLWSWVRKPLSWLFERYENHVARHLASIVTATSYIADRFVKQNACTCAVRNFPILRVGDDDRTDEADQEGVCYVGSISRVRGILELIDSLEPADTILHLAGEFTPPGLLRQAQARPGWSRVTYYGLVAPEEVSAIVRRARVGLVTLHPAENYLSALPVKLFEYMREGLPVVASAFPLWRSIVEGERCGLCVDPQNPTEIAKAVRYLLDNPVQAREMGSNGRAAVRRLFNWESEEASLLGVYRKLLPSADGGRPA